MKTIQSEYVRTDENNKDWWRCIIVAESDPDNKSISGADVEGVPDEDGIAAGSVLLTPSANYVFYADGTAGEPKEYQLLKIEIDPPITLTPALTTIYPKAYDDLTDEEKIVGIAYNATATEAAQYGDEFDITVTPCADWYATDLENFGDQGEAMTITATVSMDDDSLVLDASCGVCNANDWDAPEVKCLGIEIWIEFPSQA